MNQDLTAWKFRTQKSDGNIYSDFEDKFGALSDLFYTYYIFFSKLGNLGV